MIAVHVAIVSPEQAASSSTGSFFPQEPACMMPLSASASKALSIFRSLIFFVLVGAALAVDPPPLFPSVVTDVQGRPPSQHYTAEVFYGDAWMSVYVFESTAKAAEKNPSNGYFAHLNGWTASWVSSQLPPGGGELLLRVRRAGGGSSISTAVVHPKSSGAIVVNISSTDGVVLSVSRHARIAVDFDGAMDENDTGPNYAGPPIKSFCWFVDAAPQTGSLPDPTAPNTVVVRPGDSWPSNLNPKNWPTVIFAPGVHRGPPVENNWTIFDLTPQTRYFFCAGAVVHAALVGGSQAWGQNGITVDGFGVISGEEMDRGGETNNSPVGISYKGLQNSSVLGVTLVDFPNHHLILGQLGQNTLSNVKVLGWRSNGDGLHVFGTWAVSDLFMRTQDDTMYLHCGDCATKFERITTWNDANGASFLFSAGGGSRESVTLTDSDVIYARASWAFWPGGRVFSQRGAQQGKVMSGVLIDNVRVEDSLPTMNAINIDMTTDGSGGVSTGAFSNVVFSNIAIANFSTMRKDFAGNPLPRGLPNLFFALSRTVNISNVAFINVTLAARPLGEIMADPTAFNISAADSIINCTVDGVPITASGSGSASLSWGP